MPFVRFLVPLIGGILLQSFVDFGFWVFLFLSLIGFLGLWLIEGIADFRKAYRLRLLHAPFIFLVMFGIGGMATELSHPTEQEVVASVGPEVSWYRARLIESITEKKNSYRTVVELTQLNSNKGWQPTKGKLLIYLEKDSLAATLEQGDVLLFENKSKGVAPPSNPGEFDYKGYLAIKNIYSQQYIKSAHWQKVNSIWTLGRQAERARNYFIRRLEGAGLQDDELAIATALLLGQKDRLSSTLMHAYAGAGAMHVLAVSGLHVGILFTMLGWMLIRLEKLKNGVILKAILMVISLWAYAFITGLSPSVVRASTMFTAVLIGKALKRNSDIYNNIASSAFVLLLFDPYYLFQVGFQLSYLAVVGIIYLQPRIKELYYPPNKILRWGWEISCVSIAAQLATFPLSLLYFHQFPVYFLLSNLVVIPAAAFILYIGLTYLMLSWVPFVGEFLGVLLKWIIQAMNMGVTWIESLPFSVMRGIDITATQTALIYAVVLCGIVYFTAQKRRALLYALSLVVLLLAWQIHETVSFKSHDYLAVYNVRKHSVVNLLSNDFNLLLCDTVFAQDDGTQDYQLSGNWYRHGSPPPTFNPDSVSENKVGAIGNGLYTLNSHRLAVVNSKESLLQLSKPLQVDYLVLSYFKGMRWSDVAESYSASMVIFDSTIQAKKAKKMMEAIPSEIRLHAIAIDGYFEDRLD